MSVQSLTSVPEGGYRTRRTFSVSSYVVLRQIEQELSYHRDICTSGGFDGSGFTLEIECPDTAIAVWEVRVVVLTFDPASSVQPLPDARVGQEPR